MSSNDIDSRMSLIKKISEIKSEIEKALVFYENLEGNMHEEEHWTLKMEFPYGMSVSDFKSKEFVLPSVVLKAALDKANLYISSLEIMTEDQISAFFLGLGLSWVEIPFWDFERSLLLLKNLEKNLNFYKKLEKSLSSEEKWKIEEMVKPILQMLVPAKRTPSEILEEQIVLLKSQTLALENWNLMIENI